MKGTKKIGAMLILAAFLMGAGCKPQQESPGATTPAPEQPKPNPKPSTPAVVQETIHFEGYIEKDVQGVKKVPYFVTVSLSHNKVGATAETVESGILYIGKSDYDAENGTIDISLADARGVEEAITLTATYEKATKVLIVSEFDGMDRKAILTRVTKPGEGSIKRYNTMVNLGDPIGEAFLSLIVKEQHVTAILVAGEIKEDGTTGRARTYNATGYVRRGKVFVEIPLDKTNTHVVEVNGTFSGGAVYGVTASLIGSALKTHEEHLHHNAEYSDLPLFKPVTFTINSKQRVIDGDGPHGNNTNKKAYLTLRAVPIVKALGTTDVKDAGSNKNGYKTFGYRMYAQFTGFDKTKSREAYVDVHCLDPNGNEFTSTTAPANYNPTTKTYEFNFESLTPGAGVTNAFGNGGGFSDTAGAYAFKIKGWRPEKVSDTVLETVTTGDYEIEVPATSTGNIPGSAGAVFATACYGSKSWINVAHGGGTAAPQNGYVYPLLDNTQAATTIGLPAEVNITGLTPVELAALKRKAKYLFAEQFELVYANRPSGY